MLALVLEGAALLAGVAWGGAVLLDRPAFRGAAAAARSSASRPAAAVVLGVLMVLGNRPSARRVRRLADQAAAK